MLPETENITITVEEIRRELTQILKDEFFTMVTGDSLAIEQIEDRGGVLTLTMEDGAKFIISVKKVA